MNDLFILYREEIKKILSKRSVWIAMGASLLFVLLVGFTNFSADGHGAYVKTQEKTLTEISGQKLDQEFLDAYHARVDKEIREHWDRYEKISAYDPGAMYQNASAATGQKALYDLLYTIAKNREKVAEVTETELYAAMRENIIKDGREIGSSEEEIGEWLTVYDGIEKPIVYSYALAYLNILDVLFIIGWALIICISIALAGMFADEKTNRTDAIILASRKGRTPVCMAKILAGVSVALFQAVILLGGCFGMMFAFYGTAGWNFMIQNVIPSSPWNITIGKMVLICLALAALVSIFFAMTNVLLSQITKSAVITMALHAAVIFAGLFNMPGKMGLAAKLWQLRPTMLMYYGTFCNTYMYGKLNNVEASFCIYGIGIILMVFILIRSYGRSQIESR